MSAPTLALFAYPWDILDRGAAAFAEECRAWGITRLHVPAIYHSGKFLLPRHSGSRVYFPSPGSLYLAPSGDFFGEVRPDVHELASTNWLADLAREGLPLTAWTVFHHNSVLGTRHPHLATRNLFGDAYPFSLCPSQPVVRDYAVALARTVAAAGCFDTIGMETIGYLGYYHGYHHEVTAVPAGPLERFLLSLCFCEACRREGARRGIGVEALAAGLRALLERKFRCDDACTRHPDNTGQLAALVAATPALQQWIRMRLETVTGLIRRIREAAGALRLSVYTSGFVGAPANVWMEGVDLQTLREIVHSFHLLSYMESPEDVNADLAMCLFLAGEPARLNLTLNLGLPSTPTLAHALAKVEYAWKQGVRDFSFYNYGFLGEGRLAWLRELTARIRDLPNS